MGKSLLLLSGALLLASIGAADAKFRWKTTGEKADWGYHDYTCSKGGVPVRNLCNYTSEGTVAVCWLNRPGAECGGATTWCTYKDIKYGTVPPNGGAPGLVFVCRNVR